MILQYKRCAWLYVGVLYERLFESQNNNNNENKKNVFVRDHKHIPGHKHTGVWSSYLTFFNDLVTYMSFFKNW